MRLSEPTLLQAAKGVLCPHVGGTETHQAQYCKGAVGKKGDTILAGYLRTVCSLVWLAGWLTVKSGEQIRNDAGS